MKNFSTFEDFCKAYPINNKTNAYFIVSLHFCYASDEEDVKRIKLDKSNGFFISEEHTWYYWTIAKKLWYDTYIYHNNQWKLGIEGINTFIPAIEPKWGIHPRQKYRTSEYGIFKTKEEAEDFLNRKLKERLEF